MNYTYTELTHGYKVVADEGYKLKITTKNGERYAYKATVISLDKIEAVADVAEG